ncbi:MULTISPECIES: cell division protein FtsZ [Methylomonas]|uniref:Cell division protein FtsZ n=1 Tax=Methylomonas koyamae TaxID=702114 RepID=A0A291IPQ6_9GAMM|nr:MULTISPECIES: cell division protein FtsZ [Methylomonas]ANE57232.1 cell division protein FtsZ [Methylomonas sp. DH-1]ATG92210.1 cell division protein FtsZ [Methylomonas koyamae]OAI25647.1 cell division protein FtsZ [Methylomonas koyamae]WNB75663.1 cell division protein FtsZ [Methylomonas koyamae]BBL60452.1 cell division protein FtsZ [Methylomonas koyamae]
MKYELLDSSGSAVIKVIGVGGGGGNAVNHMAADGIDGVQFICANTDAQALREMNVESIVQLGVELTKGLGAGTRPEIGRAAAEENRDRIREVISGADMVFLTAGMGGGTGTGAISVFAEVAKELGVLTVAVVSKPFDFEGSKKKGVADAGLRELEKLVDSLIIIPNQKLLPTLGNNKSLVEAFRAANDVLRDAVQGITELITHPGLMNVDFADVRTVMSNMGSAIMGTGVASGENRARLAAEKAIACPLLDDNNLQGARGILVNVTSNGDLGLNEFDEIGSIMHAFASEDADMKIGMAVNPAMGNEIKVTVVATGMGDKAKHAAPISLVKKVAAGEVDYGQLEKPTVIRQQKQESTRESRFGAQPRNDVDLDYLDVPAFLRRQAD